MKYNPHNYQKYAIEFIKQHPIAAILLDMGMGKTSIVLSALNELMYNSFEVTKILIIAPLRVARNTWSDEIKKWDHLKGLRYSIAVGTATERKKALAADADIFIINRENVQWLVEQSGVPFDFDMVVIDELSSFKNWQAKRFKSFMKVRPMVKRVVGLTGTPSSNGLMDLFAEFKVLDMGERLGRFIGQYRVNYFNPFCVKCYEEGHITMATVVDHIVPHRGDQKLFWDRGNWQPLCEHHHNVKTMTEDRYVEYKF